MQDMNFTAIDFETANSKRGSVCAVGLAKVRDGLVVRTDSWLIRPPASIGEFAPRHIQVHGIRPADVRSAPSWSESLQRITAFAGADPFVAHNASFDRSVLRGACEATGLTLPGNTFHCSVDLARRLLDLEGNKLPQVVRALGLGAFSHHDAGSDAEMCAAAVLAIARRHGLRSLEELWPARSTPSAGSHRYARTPTRAELPRPAEHADPSHPLYGQVVVFTGDLATLTREEAMVRSAALGATPANNITKKTTMLVLGQADPARRSAVLTSGSGKERKAQQYIDAGQAIRPVSEWELRAWFGLVQPDAPEPDDQPGALESAVTGLLAWMGRRRVR